MAGIASPRFHTLDALRGIAAIAVMVFHAGDNSPLPMPGGYLAADLFFVLSGFVLAHGYEARLLDSMSLKTFVVARLRRIYPVFWLGALLGCVLLGGSITTMLMIPSLTEGGLLFDSNWPLWSLLFELIANLVWAAALVQLSTRALGWLVAVLALGLSTATLTYTIADMGAFWLTIAPGLVRTFYSFLLGVILFRLYRRGEVQPQTSLRAWLLLPVLALLLMLAPPSRTLFDLLMLGLIIPAVVWLGAHWTLPAPRFAAWLGGLSFPLYCLHAPFVAFVHAPAAVMALFFAAMIALATMVDRLFDRPIQARLKAMPQETCPSAQALI
ncbi:MAG: acyltransferase [Novosphingobium sp.]|uniref:acyltransferase family protein n=1 Tax=Novosphingobium sp. TaxID=1874826 RepID=UPI003C7CC029